MKEQRKQSLDDISTAKNLLAGYVSVISIPDRRIVIQYSGNIQICEYSRHYGHILVRRKVVVAYGIAKENSIVLVGSNGKWNLDYLTIVECRERFLWKAVIFGDHWSPLHHGLADIQGNDEGLVSSRENLSRGHALHACQIAQSAAQMVGKNLQKFVKWRETGGGKREERRSTSPRRRAASVYLKLSAMGPLSTMARWNWVAAGTSGALKWMSTLSPPALCPNMVTLVGSPPKSAMLSWKSESIQSRDHNFIITEEEQEQDQDEKEPESTEERIADLECLR